MCIPAIVIDTQSSILNYKMNLLLTILHLLVIQANGPSSKSSRTASSQKKATSSTRESSEPSSPIPDNIKASKESLNERTSADPSPRYEQLDNMDIISPIREGNLKVVDPICRYP